MMENTESHLGADRARGSEMRLPKPGSARFTNSGTNSFEQNLTSCGVREIQFHFADGRTDAQHHRKFPRSADR